MAASHEQTLTAIRKAIKAGVKQFLAALVRDWPGEQMYALLLEVNREGTRVEAVAATEEGLTRLVGQGGESARRRLRWASPEEGWYANYDAAFFEPANARIALAHSDGMMTAGDEQLHAVCLEALRELDALDVFGTEAAREKVLVGLCHVNGDHTTEEFLRWARAVNPPVVVQRLRREMKG
jgi:hypothetical protein